MWFSVSEHLAVTFYSLIMGLFLGVLYDLVKLTRIFFKIGSCSRITEILCAKKLPIIGDLTPPNTNRECDSATVRAVYFIGDILYAVISAAFYSLFLFHAIRGHVRWYFIVASAIGFFLYYFSVSKLVLCIFEVIMYFVRVVFAYSIAPFRFLLGRIFKLLQKIYGAVVMRSCESLKYSLAKKRTKKAMSRIKDSINFGF